MLDFHVKTCVLPVNIRRPFADVVCEFLEEAGESKLFSGSNGRQ